MNTNSRDESNLHEHDSFLDIVANMVGILIILVLVVSIRAKDAPVRQKRAELPPIDLATPQATVASLQRDVLQLADEAIQLDQLLAARDQQRQVLATMLAAAREEIKERRGALGQRQREKFDLQQQLEAARRELEKIELQRIHLAGIKPEVVRIDSLPTPISEKVFGKEIHLQLRGGYLVEVPLDDLFEEAKGQARQKTWKLDETSEVTELVGPLRGFRLRYMLEKRELPLSVRLETGRTGHIIRARRWELIPTESQLGEPVPVALSTGSTFLRLLDQHDPRETTITVWTYPDSFESYRQLKKELYRRGFPTAARPLPIGASIAGSPQGTRSHAQ
ncbi:MAG: hypothetical protein GTO03_17115 [Planctomycetales bacterium]|nr:hypothetical protein [Planctomycetales bacterium]